MTYRTSDADQQIDIRGSLNQSDGLNISDEPLLLGAQISNGSSGSITISPEGFVIVGNVGNVNVGNFLQITFGDSQNIGSFFIHDVASGNGIIINPNAITDSHNGSVVWIERQPYSLEDDLNYERSDRSEIKGLPYYEKVPTYIRPDATNVNVPANLSNIAGKTTDAKGIVINRRFSSINVPVGSTYFTLTSSVHPGTPGTAATVTGTTDAYLQLYLTPIYSPQTLVLKIDGVQYDITLDTGSNLGQVAAAINAACGDGSCTANSGRQLIITDATGAVGTSSTVEIVSGTSQRYTGSILDIFGLTPGVTSGIPGVPGVPGFGNLKWADSINTLGVPIWDGYDAGNWSATFVGITDINNQEFSIDGYRIIGRARAGSGTSPDSFEVELRAVLIGQDISTSISYTWESCAPILISGYYPYRVRLDQMNDSDLRNVLINGIGGLANPCGGGTGSGGTGAQGPQGSPGVTGAQGVTGPAGIDGVTGAQGNQGSPGVTGSIGPQGPQGVPGPGISGTISYVSDTQGGIVVAIGGESSAGYVLVANPSGTSANWEPLPTGPQGLQGSPGVTGLQGVTGVQGIQGSPGATGSIGVTGVQGLPGITGATGPQGATGVQGITGAQGNPGATGITGPQGEQGSTGPMGSQGSPGITGPQGIQGIQGSPGITGPIGPQGITGSIGLQGSPGITGQQGNQGSPGVTGIQGSIGETGPQGIQGSPGITGPIGATGSQGNQGSPGITGAQGETGVQGIDGNTGPQGGQGSPGVTGGVGPQGATGPQGAQGSTGAQGLQGSPGVTGAVGPQGVTGPGGSSGTGTSANINIFSHLFMFMGG
jgi:hypothetical protein